MPSFLFIIAQNTGFAAARNKNEARHCFHHRFDNADAGKRTERDDILLMIISGLSGPV
jgi:hypothetical protein